MTISHRFFLTGAVYLLLSIIIGIAMAAMDDHAMRPLHSHMILIGFVMMSIFALSYHLIPELNGPTATPHFWLHQLGSLIMFVGLFLKYGMGQGPTIATSILIFGAFILLAGAMLWLIGIAKAKRF